MRAAILLLALLVLAPAAAAETRILVEEQAFSPATARASTWETVVWRWPPNETHGIAPDDGGAAWCAPSAEGCARVLSEPGEYRYHCPVHPDMRGTVVVGAEAGDAGVPLRASFRAATDGLHATFDASATAASRTAIARYEWDLGDGSEGRGRILTHEYAAPGRYQVTLAVVDEFGRTSSFSRAVLVTPPPDPVARFEARPSGRSVQFEAVPAPGRHVWDLGDGEIVTCDAACGGASAATLVSAPTSLVHVYRRGGEFTIRHEVTDANGTRNMTLALDVEGEETFALRTEGLTLHVDASALPRYGNATFSWLFGDLTRAEGVTATHTLPRAGLWSVDLVLEDEAGRQELAREALLDGAPAASTPAPEPAPAPAPVPAAPLALLLAACAVAARASQRYK